MSRLPGGALIWVMGREVVGMRSTLLILLLLIWVVRKLGGPA
jgi:flagellar biogenesis protein FliO